MDAQRLAMLAAIEARVGPIDPRHRPALLAVDRARFVPRGARGFAWFDEPLPLETPFGPGSATISAPHMYALGFAALDLGPGDRLLELGSGSGYGAALASEVVGPSGRITTVEVDPYLARWALTTTAGRANVRVLHDDGLRRSDLLATHEKCWLTFAVESVPDGFVDGLREGGLLVAPVGSRVEQRLLRYRRASGATAVDDLGPVRFVGARPLIDDGAARG
jgi:protein-L-isoaspartate(D-aspartate) O-methyltransferase